MPALARILSRRLAAIAARRLVRARIQQHPHQVLAPSHCRLVQRTIARRLRPRSHPRRARSAAALCLHPWTAPAAHAAPGCASASAKSARHPRPHPTASTPSRGPQTPPPGAATAIHRRSGCSPAPSPPPDPAQQFAQPRFASPTAAASARSSSRPERRKSRTTVCPLYTAQSKAETPWASRLSAICGSSLTQSAISWVSPRLTRSRKLLLTRSMYQRMPARAHSMAASSASPSAPPASGTASTAGLVRFE